MTTPIKIRRSGTASSTPSSLDHGELAINYADATLFWKDSSNTIQSFVFQAYASATHKSTHATGGSDALTPGDIGAAPAASPTFTGTVTVPGLTSTGVILADDAATSGSVVYSFDGDPNTGIGRAGADVLTVVTNGSERVRVTSGGTLAVTTNLEIHGGATAFPTADTSAFIGRTDATGSAPFDQAGSLVYRPRVSSTAGRSSHIFYTGSPSVERLRINETGAAIFSGVITVSAASGSAGSYLPSVTISGDANTGFGQVSGQSDTASVFTAGHERLRVKSTGAVRFVPLSADPASGEAGDVYYNSSTNKLRVYNGTSWGDLH